MSVRGTYARAVCRACGRAFAGVNAFDAHQVGSFSAPRDSPEARRCIDPADDPRFESTQGIDAIGDPDAPRETAIWALAEARARARYLYAENGPQAADRKRKSRARRAA